MIRLNVSYEADNENTKMELELIKVLKKYDYKPFATNFVFRPKCDHVNERIIMFEKEIK